MTEVQSDVVTQIQESLDNLSVSLYSTIGALQRDAKPASVRGEPVAANARQADSQALATSWAGELVALSKKVDNIILKLPDVSSTEEQELKSAAAAIEENNAIGEELRRETAQTEQLLAMVRTMYGALADSELESRALKNAVED